MADVTGANANLPTPAIFRQLHVKLPTETFREELPKEWREKHPNQEKTNSDQWLDVHSKGLMLIHNLLLNYPIGRAILIESLDTGTLIVNKRFARIRPVFDPDDHEFEQPDYRDGFTTRNPNELRISTLDDPRVEGKLPSAPYFATLYAYGLPQGIEYPDRQGRHDIFSLYFRHYNGGTLRNLMEMYGDSEIGAPIPEPFIWHVMDQLGRAVLSLRKGCSNNFIEQNLGVDQLLKLRLEDGKSHPWDQWDKNWRPIVHGAITERNVLLHFREDGEPLTRCFPQVVLEGFDKAGFVDEYFARVDENETPYPETDARHLAWKDLHMIGQIFARLVTNQDAPRDHSRKHAVDVSEMLAKYLPENLTLADGQKPAYSKELISLLQRWGRLVPGNVQGQDQDGGVTPPNPEHFFFEYLSITRKKVEMYRRMKYEDLAPEDGDGLSADVSWVKPDPTFAHIPYAAGRGREDRLLARMREDLRWLFGPYIPVWHRYDGVDVSEIPPEAETLYTITAKADSDQREQMMTMETESGMEIVARLCEISMS
jgi:hypothetical protein